MLNGHAVKFYSLLALATYCGIKKDTLKKRLERTIGKNPFHFCIGEVMVNGRRVRVYGCSQLTADRIKRLLEKYPVKQGVKSKGTEFDRILRIIIQNENRFIQGQPEPDTRYYPELLRDKETLNSLFE
jgi:hypothetical protein